MLVVASMLVVVYAGGKGYAEGKKPSGGDTPADIVCYHVWQSLVTRVLDCPSG